MGSSEESKGVSRGKCLCAMCGSENISTKEEDYDFPYGTEEKSAQITAHVTVNYCEECGFSWLDNMAQELCHEAVCRHEGVMSPAEIRKLRDSYGLSQSEFADATGLGVATVSRWERGIVIQNEAYDKYLSLLKLPLNFERFHRTIEKVDEIIGERRGIAKLRVLERDKEVLERQQNFKLRTFYKAAKEC